MNFQSLTGPIVTTHPILLVLDHPPGARRRFLVVVRDGRDQEYETTEREWYRIAKEISDARH